MNLIVRIAILLKELCIIVQNFVIWNYIKIAHWEIFISVLCRHGIGINRKKRAG